MQLFLVRHGETDWNAERRVQGQSESNLNANGRQQAEQLRPWVESVGFTAIYSSSSVRTVQTAEILTANPGLPLNKKDNLKEIHLGPWEQLLWSDIEQSSTQEFSNFRDYPHLFNLEGAETFIELRDRGIAGLKEVHQQQKMAGADQDAKILVVSHGALIAAVLAGLASVCLSRLRKQPSLDNCSVSEINVDAKDRLHVVSIAGMPLHESPWFEES